MTREEFIAKLKFDNQDCFSVDYVCEKTSADECNECIFGTMYDTYTAPLVAENERLKEACAKEMCRVENELQANYTKELVALQHKYEVEHKENELNKKALELASAICIKTDEEARRMMWGSTKKSEFTADYFRQQAEKEIGK